MAGCTVSAIAWDRVNLTLTATLAADPGAAVQFMIVSATSELPVRTTAVSAHEYRLELNLTNFAGRQQVPDGTYEIVAHLDGEAGPRATWDLRRLDELDNASRTFLYSANEASYIVAFAMSDQDDPVLLLHVWRMFRKAAPTTSPTLSRRVRNRVIPRARRVRFANRWYRLARRLHPPNGKRILFASEMRTKMEGNLLRLHDRMVERGLDRTFEFQFNFRVPSTSTKWSTLRVIWLLAVSDIVLIDDYFGVLGALQLSPDTKIIQAWHAGSGFKNIGYSRFGRDGSPKLQNAHRKYTYAITGSQHLIPVYAEAFGIEESAVIPTGLPRIDTFLDEARTERVVADFRRDHPELTGKRLILFAPTFRGRGVSTAFYDYARLDFDKLYDVCGDDTVILFRMHHFIAMPVPIPPEYADRLIDFGDYPDTNDLLHLTDVLITDYSSIIYEFSLLDRPMLFFAYDKDVYAATRGFHRNYEDTAPGRICESTDDLVKAIQTDDYETWKIERFREENFDRIDTDAADRVIDWLILDDPRTSRAASSEAATRDPSTGDTALGDAQLRDQAEA